MALYLAPPGRGMTSLRRKCQSLCSENRRLTKARKCVRNVCRVLPQRKIEVGFRIASSKCQRTLLLFGLRSRQSSFRACQSNARGKCDSPLQSTIPSISFFFCTIDVYAVQERRRQNIDGEEILKLKFTKIFCNISLCESHTTSRSATTLGTSFLDVLPGRQTPAHLCAWAWVCQCTFEYFIFRQSMPPLRMTAVNLITVIGRRIEGPAHVRSP